MRKITALTDGWRFLKAAIPVETAVQYAPQGEAVTLPHTWNAVDGQDGGNDYYRGSCWYVRELSAEAIGGLFDLSYGIDGPSRRPEYPCDFRQQ